MDRPKIKYKDGEPCKEHKACLSHRTHPCEGCGRVGARGIVWESLKFDGETK